MQHCDAVCCGPMKSCFHNASRPDDSMQLGLKSLYVLSDADALPRTLPGPAVLVYKASISLSMRTASSLVYLIA